MPPPEHSPSSAAVAVTASPSVSGRLDAATVRTILLGIMLAMFLSSLDQTIVSTALPAIGRELGAVENLPWVITAYLLSATAITPLYGKLSDIYGRRAVLLTGIGVFTLGSIGCGLAQTMPALVLARAVQGLGGGGLIVMSQTIIADIMSPRERALWQAYFGIVFAGANLAGAVLGGFFAQYLHWSLIFWMNVPIGIAALAITGRALSHLPQNHRPHRLDIIGAALMASATIALLLALTWGGTLYPWASPVVVSLLAASLAFWILFALRIATAAEPFLPLTVLGNPLVRNAIVSSFFGMGTLVGLSVYVPVYLQVVMGLSPSAAGLGLIPLLGFGVIGATISGRAIAFVEHYKRIPLAGLTCGSLAMAVLALYPAELPLGVAISLLGITGLATGSLFPVSTVSLQAAVHPHQLGTATASLNFFRQLGGAILVAAFGAILLGTAGIAGGRAATVLTGAEGVRQAALGGAFGWIFAASAVGLASAGFFLFLMEERPLLDRAPGPPAAE
jgi:EmrB/QacA subfamily drug resistance transporter